MANELILWSALALLIALMALAVWAGRRGLHALGVVGPRGHSRGKENDLDELVVELRRLNANLEQLLDEAPKHDLTQQASAKQQDQTAKAHAKSDTV